MKGIVILRVSDVHYNKIYRHAADCLLTSYRIDKNHSTDSVKTAHVETCRSFAPSSERAEDFMNRNSGCAGQSKLSHGDKMKCVVLFEHEKSNLIADAVKPDNTPYMEMKVRRETITVEIITRNLASLIATVDDYLVNIKIAKDLLEMKLVEG